MKLITLFTLGILAYVSAIAQPTITMTNHPMIGDRITMVSCDTTGVKPGAGGANQVWDFSRLTDLGPSTTQRWMKPEDTPYANWFLEANIASFEDSAYSYYKLGNDRYEFLGSQDPTQGDFRLVMNNTPLITMPITFNSTQQDNFRGAISLTFNNTPINGYTTGTIKNEADGYGKLILPGATYENVIRIKLTQPTRDTFTVFGQRSTSSSNFESYQWWSPSLRGELLTIDMRTSSGQGNGDEFEKTVKYRTNNPSTATLPSLPALKQVQIYPNPVPENMQIQLDMQEASDVVAELYSITGALVAKLEQRQLPAGKQSLDMNVSQLSSGIYTLRITCGNTTHSQKITKQ